MSILMGIKAKSQVANVWLLGFFVSSAVVMVVKFLYSSGQIIEYPHWFKANYPAGLLRPVFVYLYLHFLLNGIAKVRWSHSLHFIPFLILLTYMSGFFAQSAEYKLAVLNLKIINTLGMIPSWYFYFQYAYSIAYIILIFVDFKAYVQRNPNPSKSQKSLILWAKYMFAGGVIFLGIAAMLRLAGFTNNFNYGLYEVFSVLMVILCIKFLTMPEVPGIAVNGKYSKSSLSESEINSYYEQIGQLMESERLFKMQDLKLRHISKKLSIPDYLISQIINQKSQQSFRNYLNTYRIEEAKKMLLQSHNHYSIEGIASDVGFKSRTSFYNAFKRETKVTPSEYQASQPS